MSAPKPEETSRQRFVRLANKRVANAMDAIRLIGNLSNRSSYDYSEQDVEKIFQALTMRLRKTELMFKLSSQRKPSEQNAFSLSDDD